MEKLFENWRRFVLKEDLNKNVGNLEHNAKALETMPVQGYSGEETIVSKFGILTHSLFKLIYQIKPLKTNKIIKGAGAGKYGITYMLDNDHILKFFLAGHNS